MKEKYNEFVFPRIGWVYLSLFICLLAWVGVLYFHVSSWLLKGLLIVFSLYSGLISAYSIPQIVTEVLEILNHNKYFTMFMNDLHVRMFATLYMNLLINFIYAALNVINGIRYDSNWQMALGLYYIILAMMRFYLLSYVNKYETQKGMKAGEIEIQEFKKYRMTGWFLILILIPLVWILLQMIEENHSYNYSGAMIYVMVLFNIYVWGMVIFSQMMNGKADNIILTSTRAIGLACALVSTLALLTSVLTNIGYQHEVFSREAMIALLGMVECLIIFSIAVHMINRAHWIISMNSMPRRFRQKVSLKEKRQARKEAMAKEKEIYAQFIADHWQGNEIKYANHGSRVTSKRPDQKRNEDKEQEEPVLELSAKS